MSMKKLLVFFDENCVKLLFGSGMNTEEQHQQQQQQHQQQVVLLKRNTRQNYFIHYNNIHIANINRHTHTHAYIHI